MAELKFEHVEYVHGKDTPYAIQALRDVTAQIPSGKITGIIGHTGSGKSTLVQMFNGILKPDSGRILLDDFDIWSKPKQMRNVRFRVGLVMQYAEYQLFEETVAKDIAYGPSNMKLSEEEIREHVEEAASFVGIEKELLDKSPFDLSGGQKRRVAIAGILAMRPDVLVLDEPAAGLDPKGRDAIFSNLSEYQRKSGKTVVIVSHSMEDMARFCDFLLVLSNGSIALQGTPQEIFASSERLFEIGLDIPQITKLMLLLKEKGLPIDIAHYTVDSAYQEILNLLKNR